MKNVAVKLEKVHIFGWVDMFKRRKNIDVVPGPTHDVVEDDQEELN